MSARRSALIFGGTGQDGAYLIRLLLGKGYDVHATSRTNGPMAWDNCQKVGITESFQEVKIDPLRLDEVTEVIRRIRPSEIYNLSGPSSVAGSFKSPKSTIEGITSSVSNLLEAIIGLRQKDVRVFNAASGDCFGQLDEAATETTAFKPISPYGVAKSEAVELIRRYRKSHGLYCCSGILFNHESRLRSQQFVIGKVLAFLRRCRDGYEERLQINDLSVVRDWGWAPEYVDAFWRMLQLETPLDLVIASGKSVSLETFVSRLFREAGLDWKEYVYSPYRSSPRSITRSFADPRLAKEILGWTAEVDIDNLARRLVDGTD